MHFDPITGEKIMDPGDEIQGQADQGTQSEQAQGQTFAQDGRNQAQFGQGQSQFNQAAGQFGQTQNQFGQPQGRFDQAQGNFQQGQFTQPQFAQGQPGFGQAPTDGNKVKKGLPIGAVIGIVAAILVVIAGVAFFALKGTGAKVSLLTLANTSYDGSYLMDSIKEVGLKPGDDLSVSANVDVEELEFNLSFARNESKHTGSVYADVTYSGFTLDFTGYIDEKKVKLASPVITDYLFVYDYSNKKNDGYFIELLEDEGIDVEDFNTMIAFLNDNTGLMKKYQEKTTEYYKDCLDSVEFEKTGAKDTFNVNGKDITCKEYKAVITSDTVTGWIEGYQDMLESFIKENSDEIEVLEDIAEEELDLDDAFEDMLDEAEDMEDIEISVFAKGTTVAAIIIEYDDEPLGIYFKGGDYLAQNVVIEFDGDEVLTIEGKTNGDVQTSVIESDEFTIEYSYNKKTGALTIESDDYDFEFEGKLTCKKGEISLSVDTLEIYGDSLDVDTLVVTISNKPEIREPKGDEFDIGNADEDELYDVVEEIYENVEDNDELYDFFEELSYLF